MQCLCVNERESMELCPPSCVDVMHVHSKKKGGKGGTALLLH